MFNLRALFHKDLAEREMDEEFRFHLEKQIEQNIARGLSPEEARYAALRQFGNLGQMKEQCRDTWGLRFLNELAQDIRYGLRQLRRNPGFTVVAILTLALGIGANTAVFTLTDALMLRSLPVKQPGQLYFFGKDDSQSVYSGTVPHGPIKWFSYTWYKQFCRQDLAFQGLAALSSLQPRVRVAWPASHEPPHQATARLVSGNFFQLLGVNAIVGRTTIPEDDRQGKPRAVAVVSYHYWAQNLGRDANVAGKVLELNGTPFTIIGVTPEKFHGVKLSPALPDFWIPLGMQPQVTMNPSWLTNNSVYWLDVFGRLKSGENPRQAGVAVNFMLHQVLTAQAGTKLSKESTRRIQASSIELVPGAGGLSSMRKSGGLLLLAMIVLLVLLIACTNVAGLLLARASRRRKEITVRLAVGASRWRIVRQLLTESILLAMLAGICGLLLAIWATRILAALILSPTARLPFALGPNGAVLAFTLAVSVLAGIVFGLVPTLRSARTDLNSSLKGSSGGGPSATRHGLLAPGKLAVAGQTALSLCLLMMAGLFVRSLRKLESQPLGFSPQHVLVCKLDIKGAGYKVHQLPSLYQRILDRMRALPGVHAAALAGSSVLGGVETELYISLPGYTPKPGENMQSHIKDISSGYFATDRMTILAGRPIAQKDTEGSPRVAVVNEAFAQRFMHGKNPVGGYFALGSPFQSPGIRIVGVTANAKYDSLREQTPPMVFLPLAQNIKAGSYAGDLELRVAGDPAGIATQVRRALGQVDSKLLLVQTTTLPDLVEHSTREMRLTAQLTSFFGLLALLLASLGLYGVMGQRVARRTNEIGVRMALGAKGSDVLRMVLHESLMLVLFGTALGVPAAVGLGHLVSSLLFDVSAFDPISLFMAVMLLLASAVWASYIPARRAARVNPTVALRYE